MQLGRTSSEARIVFLAHAFYGCNKHFVPCLAIRIMSRIDLLLFLFLIIIIIVVLAMVCRAMFVFRYSAATLQINDSHSAYLSTLPCSLVARRPTLALYSLRMHSTDARCSSFLVDMEFEPPLLCPSYPKDAIAIVFCKLSACR